MKHGIVRSKVKPERSAENEQLVRVVYAELHETGPDGLRYIGDRCEEAPVVSTGRQIRSYRFIEP
jgi:hypothetical protein